MKIISVNTLYIVFILLNILVLMHKSSIVYVTVINRYYRYPAEPYKHSYIIFIYFLHYNNNHIIGRTIFEYTKCVWFVSRNLFFVYLHLIIHSDIQLTHNLILYYYKPIIPISKRFMSIYRRWIITFLFDRLLIDKEKIYDSKTKNFFHFISETL